MTQGVIYILSNRVNGMIYVGQTDNLNRRIQHHIYAATHIGTRNEGQPIVKAIREFGFDAFDCSILETIIADNDQELRKMLDERERHYISEYNSVERGYNVTYGGCGMLGYELSEDARVAISKAHTGKTISDKHKEIVRESSKRRWEDEDFRNFMSERMSGCNNPMFGVRLTGERNHNFGKPQPESVKQKISAAKKGCKGHPMSESTKMKLAQAAKLPKSEAHKKKISESLTGRINTLRRKPVVQYTRQGEYVKEWECVTEAEETLGIVHVSECANRKRNYAGGFIWRWKSDNGNIAPTPKNTRQIIQMDLNGNIINTYSSIREASKALGICYSSISAVLQGVQRKAGGYLFRYYLQ